MNEYCTCWRISGDIDASIDKCPKGDTDKCLKLMKGDICDGGRIIAYSNF